MKNKWARAYDLDSKYMLFVIRRIKVNEGLQL